MPNLSIRGLDPITHSALKSLASQQGESVNALLLRLIDRGLGRVPDKSSLRRYDDLDALAGVWSEDEAAEFLANIERFGQVEPEQ